MANINSVDLQTYIRDLIGETIGKPDPERRSFENAGQPDGKDGEQPNHPDEVKTLKQ